MVKILKEVELKELIQYQILRKKLIIKKIAKKKEDESLMWDQNRTQKNSPFLDQLKISFPFFKKLKKVLK